MNIKKMSLKELQELIHDHGPEVWQEVIQILGSDPRGGAQKLVRTCQTRLEEHRRERDRISRMFSYERQVWAMGYKLVAGLDEVGRGPLAGPVVAAAVILPEELVLPGIEECRRLSGKRRQELYEQIQASALAIGVGMVHPEGIDEANVMMATYKAMVKAVGALSVTPDYLLIDSLHLPGVAQSQAPIAGGDGQSCSIAAASVVAKVTRDNYMVEMDKLYPQYGFASHKGYGTLEHREALEKHGPCPIHRKSYGSVREIMTLSSGALFGDE
ncbi:MAG TPA: ribonuclease HII [Symbiobacteriaceae bacterium]|jgi:ribonuclease HII|nr:ribonuclease HII [Symbiobacteriaceae bacterium]